MTGAPVLRLPPRAVAGRREVLAVPGRDGEPSFDVDERGRPSTSAFAVFHLPPDLDWRHAAGWSVLDSELTSLYGQLPPDDRPWPRSTVHRRHAPDHPGDSTVLEVDGTRVGVQVDRSGAVGVRWSLRRPSRGTSRVWDLTLLTRGSAVAVVQDVREAGLLG
ncbi:hypothetical protein [Kineococcus sp. SYSU DK001]|uniref:hypothetical protein n=1 Tax=Kineococcus sp. SYSU DK001 TaxID=3383122 RepID=UPI003D7DD209